MYQKLTTESRSTGKKVSLKSLRNKGVVPGVIYGKEIDSLPIQVPANKLHKFLGDSGQVFEVQVGGDVHLVNLDNVQWDHLGNKALHVSFHKLIAGQKTRVTVPINYVGESKGHKLEGGVDHYAYNEVEVEGLPRDIPAAIEVDVSDLEMNDSIQLKDIALPKGCEWMEDVEIVLAVCQPPRAEKVEEPVSPEQTPTIGEEDSSEGGEQVAADSDEGESSEGEKVS